jgi:hypothetical protein
MIQNDVHSTFTTIIANVRVQAQDENLQKRANSYGAEGVFSTPSFL